MLSMETQKCRDGENNRLEISSDIFAKCRTDIRHSRPKPQATLSLLKAQ